MFYKVSEVAEILKISPFRVRELIKKGYIEAVKPVGSQWRVSKESLDSYLRGE